MLGERKLKYNINLLFFIFIYNLIFINNNIYCNLSNDVDLFYHKSFGKVFFGINNPFNSDLESEFICDNDEYSGAEYSLNDGSFLMGGIELGYMFEPISISLQLDYSKFKIYSKNKTEGDGFIITRNYKSKKGDEIDFNGTYLSNVSNIHYAFNINYTFNIRGSVSYTLGLGLGMDNMYLDAFNENSSKYKASFISRPLSNQINMMVGFNNFKFSGASPYIGYIFKHNYRADIDFQDYSLNSNIEDSDEVFTAIGTAKMNSENFHTLVMGLLFNF